MRENDELMKCLAEREELHCPDIFRESQIYLDSQLYYIMQFRVDIFLLGRNTKPFMLI